MMLLKLHEQNKQDLSCFGVVLTSEKRGKPCNVDINAFLLAFWTGRFGIWDILKVFETQPVCQELEELYLDICEFRQFSNNLAISANNDAHPTRRAILRDISARRATSHVAPSHQQGSTSWRLCP